MIGDKIADKTTKIASSEFKTSKNPDEMSDEVSGIPQKIYISPEKRKQILMILDILMYIKWNTKKNCNLLGGVRQNAPTFKLENE